jgi:hypothetical protein
MKILFTFHHCYKSLQLTDHHGTVSSPVLSISLVQTGRNAIDEQMHAICTTQTFTQTRVGYNAISATNVTTHGWI